MRRLSKKEIATGLALAGAAGAVAYALVLRPRHARWGATNEEVERAMPGDALVAHPNFVTTRAVTIRVRPQELWPWLVQMGYRRGGLYSYDWLDRLFGYLDRPSAERILPEFQRLDVGDTIPIGRGPGLPVSVIEPEHALVLGPVPEAQVTWSFGLYPVDEHATRLVTRVRYRMDRTPANLLRLAALDPAAFVMTRKMLLGIKARAERLAAGRGGQRASDSSPGG